MKAGVKRVIVLGGTGLFGRSIVEQLQSFGIAVKIAARCAMADFQIDANDPDSIRKCFIPEDLVIDAAGPFQNRTMALLEIAMEIGFDVIDLNDHLQYAEKILAHKQSIDQVGIRVLSSASSVSAITTAIVRKSKVKTPIRVTSFLAPATRHTATRGTAISLIQSLGRPVRVFRNGHLLCVPGWSEMRPFTMPQPLGQIEGRIFESADALYLPQIWPSLQEVDMYVDPNTTGLNRLLRLGARWPCFRRLLERQIDYGTNISKMFGSTTGAIGYEIEDSQGVLHRFAIYSLKNSFMTAVAPAILAARAIIDSSFEPTGLVLPDRHVNPEKLVSYLNNLAIKVTKIESP